MPFRDDKDALVERLTDLERDLKEAREGLDKKDEELRRLRERMGGLDAAPKRNRSVVIVAAAALGVVIMGAGLVFMRAKSAPAPVVVTPVAPPQPVLPVVAAPPPVVQPPNVDPVASTAPAPKPAPTADLTWKASVRASKGTFESLRAGTPCTVEVSATGGAELDFDRIAVRCGDAVVYDSRAPIKGTMMSQTSGSLNERPAKGGGFVYQLLYQDSGTRTLEARPQLEIGTERRIARAFHDGALGGSVDFTIAKDSQPRTGEALLAKKE